MAMQQIGKFSLHNGGGFVARGKVAWLDDNREKKVTDSTAGDVTLGFDQDVDPGSLGVPDGAFVSLHVVVVAGSNAEASESFIYQKGNQATAKYEITGTTLGNTLRLILAD